MSRLAISVALVFIGVLGIAGVFQFSEQLGLAALPLWIVSGATIGGGVFKLFNWPWLGVLLGVVVQVALLIYLFSQHHIVG